MSIKNIATVKEGFVEVLLNNIGENFIVSLEDYDNIKKYKWYAYKKRPTSAYYIQADYTEEGKRIKISLHRFLMGCVKGDGKIVDHINGNTFDNRRENLRIADKCGNQRNSKTQCNSITGRAGVGFHKASGKYRARIVVNDKEIYLGVYETFEEACKIREEAEIKYFKEYSSYEFK